MSNLVSTYLRLSLYLLMATLFFLNASRERRRLVTLHNISMGLLILALAMIPFLEIILGAWAASFLYRIWVLPVPLVIAVVILALMYRRVGCIRPTNQVQSGVLEEIGGFFNGIQFGRSLPALRDRLSTQREESKSTGAK